MCMHIALTKEKKQWEYKSAWNHPNYILFYYLCVGYWFVDQIVVSCGLMKPSFLGDSMYCVTFYPSIIYVDFLKLQL
jgi:hypothetical protein